MNQNHFAAQMRRTISSLKEQKHEAIRIDDLLAYLDNVLDSAYEPTATEMEQYKATLTVEVEQNKARHAMNAESFKAVIAAGQNAIRSAFLLNGGASVALLAFISKLAEQQLASGKIPQFTDCLIPFVCGVFTIALTSGVTYLSQWFYGRENGEANGWGFKLNIAAIVTGLVSYGCFLWGMWETYAVFHTYG